MSLSVLSLMPAAVTPNSQTIVTDIDGDTVNELIIFDNVLKQLSVVHQFKYTDFTLSDISFTFWPPTDPDNDRPIWTQDTNSHWRTFWATTTGAIPAVQGQSNWTIQPGDTLIAADLDGDGINELFIYNLRTFWWGVLKWNNNSNEMQVLYSLWVGQPPSQPVGPNGLAWQATEWDQYFVIPNINALVKSPAIPANAAGLLLYNLFNMVQGTWTGMVSMGMIAYSPSQQKFLQFWTLTSKSLSGGWNLVANTPPCNQFYPGFFASATVPSIVVFDPQDQYIDLLTWSGSDWVAAPNAQGGSAGSWNLQNTDVLQCADLDADGITEILIYSPSYQDIAVLKWNGNSNFQSYALTKGTIGDAPNQWTIGGNDQYNLMQGPAGMPTAIVAYSSSRRQLAVLQYIPNNDGGFFDCQWAAASLAPNNGWSVTGSDSYYVGSSPKYAQPPLFTMSNQGPATAQTFMLGAINWKFVGLEIVSSAPMPVPAWSIGFLASAPHTDFSPFVDGDQPAIYTYVSNLFPIPGQKSSGKPIRELYTHAEDSSKFYAFALDLNNVPTPADIPPNWPKPGTGWTTKDWQKVVSTIVAECNQVDTVYKLFGLLAGLIGDLNAFQTVDLTTVQANITALTMQTTSKLAYWEGQVIVALLWGLGAAGTFIFPEAEEGEEETEDAVKWAIGMSMFASLGGSLAGYNPSQVQSYEEVEMAKQVATTLVAGIVSQSKELTAILKDPVKMKIVDGLHETEWKIDSDLASKAEGPFMKLDRLWMYQQMMPFYFMIQVIEPQGALKPPPYVPGTLDLLDTSGNLVWSFPSSALSADLFTTLGVSIVDFYERVGGWANIPPKIFYRG